MRAIRDLQSRAFFALQQVDERPMLFFDVKID
jgi:hypothetical protein